MDSRIIDVAIGLALVFALTSLLAATLVEAFSSLVKLRGRVLKKAIVSFLGDDEAFAKSLEQHPLIVSLAPGTKDQSARKPSYITSDVMITSLLSHLTMQFSGGVRPTSPAELVASVVSGGLVTQQPAIQVNSSPQPNEDFTKGLASLLMGVENDWPAFENRLRAWYDSVGERSIGWYKRRTQIALMIFGLLIAGFANINPIVIAPRLWNDAALRAAMVSAGTAASEAYAQSTGASGTTNESATTTSNTAGDDTRNSATRGGSTNETPLTVPQPALVKPAPARIEVSKSTARDYAVFHYALLDAIEQASQAPGDEGSASRLRMLQEDAELPARLDRMRTPDDGSMASINARADAHAALKSSLQNLGELLASDPVYVKARNSREALLGSIDKEQEALGQSSMKRLSDCSAHEDAAARDLCLRLGDLSQLHEMGLPIGWSGDVWPNYGMQDAKNANLSFTAMNWLIVAAGWILTALATTLGAPFWFDALSRLASLRGTGPRADGSEKKTDSEKPSTLDTSGSVVGVDPSAREAMSDALNAYEKALSSFEVQRIQRGLRLNDAQLTGFFDANTRVTIRQWQTAQGADATGELTQTQIQQLLGLGQAGDSDAYAG